MSVMKRRLTLILMLISLTVSLGVLCYGLATSHVLPLHPWAEPGLWRFACFTGVFIIVAAAAFFTGPTRRGQWLAAAFLFWLMVAFGLGPMASVTLICAGALALGDLLFGIGWRNRFGLLPAALLALCIGLVLLSWLVGLAAHVPINFPPVYLTALMLMVLAGVSRLRLYAVGLYRWSGQATMGLGCYAATAILVFVLTLQSLYAALPEQCSDALAIHLLAASSMATQARWNFDPGHLMTSVGPMGADWLFTVGYLLGGEIAAKLVNFGLLTGISALLWAEIGRCHGRIAGLLGAALFASLPLTFIETASLFSENALALFGLAATVLIMRTGSTISLASTIAVAVLTAGAALVKLHGVFFVLSCGGWVLVLLVRQGRLVWAPAALLAGGVIMAPPYLYSWLSTGNPVFPWFNGIFKSSLWPTVNFDDPRWSGLLSWDMLYRWTFESSRFFECLDGAFGFALITLLLPGLIGTLAGRDRSSRFVFPLLVCGVYLLGIMPFTQYLRYFYPILPMAALLTAGVLELLPLLRLTWGGPMAAMVLSVIAVGLIGLDLRALPSASWTFYTFDPQIVLDRSRQPEWLAQRSPIRRFIDIINAMAGSKAKVLFIGAPLGAGLQGQPLYHNWYNQLLLREMNQGNTVAAARRLLYLNHITHVILTPGGPPQWQVQAYLEQSGRLIEGGADASLYEVQPDASIGGDHINKAQ